MGKMKALAMDMEEQFFDEALGVLKDGCEDPGEFVDAMLPKQHLVSHMFSNEVEFVDYLSEMWNEYWSEYSHNV